MSDYNVLNYVYLSSQIIAVATEGKVNDWTAYLGVRSFPNLEKSIETICGLGDKIPRRFAEVIFPEIRDRGLEYRF